jgi:hypothetical protein
MQILITDNDVLVEIFDILYRGKRPDFERVVRYLQMRYGGIWIPKTVRHEFQYTPSRSKLLSKHQKQYPDLLIECPVPVSRNEMILLMTDLAGIHEGEADGIQQTKKAATLRRYPQSFVFFSRDRSALRRAQEYGVETLAFEDLMATVKEAGILL